MGVGSLIERDPEKLGGTPVFAGTRVPVKNLFDYLEGGDSLDVFLDDFPTVTRQQALGVLDLLELRAAKKSESNAPTITLDELEQRFEDLCREA